MAIPMQNATTRRVRSDQRRLKKRNSEDGCTFPRNIFAPTPKITPKPILGDLSMRNLLYTELSVSRKLMEVRS